MLLERFYDDDLAQASYLIGCQQTGEAIVVDGRRDIDTYIATAKRNGMRIVAVTETHIHADYLSGTREVARSTGAKLYVSGEGGQDWQYGFDAERLHDGDVITIGNVRIQARHTPGHTPEHLVFLVTDGAFADEPGYLLSGDFVFAGDLGRPDLLDEAAGGQDTRFQGAHDMFNSLRDVFLSLEDHVQVYPAHGAGSACGKSLGAIPATTVGYERRYAWWAPLVDGDRDAFVAQLLDGQPDAHAYFARMKRENRDGPALLGDLTPVTELSQDAAVQAVSADEAIFVDTRTPDQVRTGTPVGALAIPATGKTATWGAWAVDPVTEPRPLILLATNQEQADTIRDHLVRVGIDRYAGYVTTLDGFTLTQSQQIAPTDLDTVPDAFILDVRGRGEFEEGHVPGATNVSAGRLLRDQDQVPMERPIVSYCQSGARNIVAAQALRRAGYDVRELDGSYLGWLRSKQPADTAVS
jgi:hydroxyacylglutathione hydrolase